MLRACIIWITASIALAASAHTRCEAQVPRSPTPAARCRSAGPLACEVPPSDATPDQICSQLQRCLRGRSLAGYMDTIEEVTMCELRSDPAAPTLEGQPALALVSAIVESVSDTQQFYAVYLLQKLDLGWCPVDELLRPEWSPRSCDQDVEISWSPAPHDKTGKRQQAKILAKRICHANLDQEDVPSREADIRSEECVVARYQPTDAKVARVSRNKVSCKEVGK
ncbi:MAG: hypothetical protein ABW321_02240 [Polyangiales bacterium]